MLPFINNIFCGNIKIALFGSLVIGIGSAGIVLVSKKLMRVITALGGVSLITAIIWLSLGAEFLASSLLLLINSIVLMFCLLAIVLPDYSVTENRPAKLDCIAATAVAGVFFAVLAYVIKDGNFSITTVTHTNNLLLLTDRLFDQHLLLFVLFGVFLLAGVVSVTILFDITSIGLTAKIKKSLVKRETAKIRMLSL